jgi:CTP synthase
MQTKYIFTTGGVVSGLGKGITNASIGLILKSAGLKVDVIKFDPYLNIDPGTMSPYEHGEVYVLDDGSETDLDLGHYERFLDINLTSVASVTAGKIYSKILDQEREGIFLGKNVQLIPHVTNFIKESFTREIENVDVRLIEIGGSTGDMEGEIFLESFRQFRQENKENVLHVHLGYVPYLECSGEYKTKPMQTSLRELLRSGLQPDMLIARYHRYKHKDIDDSIISKIALFSNLPSERVIGLPDMKSIYQVPGYLYNSNLEANIEKLFEKDLHPELTSFFTNFPGNNEKQKTVKIGIIAKYIKLYDSYLSVLESLKIAAIKYKAKVETYFINSEELEKDPIGKSNKNWKLLKEMEGILVPGGFGKRGMEGKILAVKYARENKVPYLGICLGLQMAVVEFARSVCGIKKAVTSEMYDDRAAIEDLDTLIDLIPEQLEIHQKGGTMRLGGYSCTISENTLAHSLFKQTEIRERHRHRLEVQGKYVPALEKGGMKISGKHHFKDNMGRDSYLVELIELDQKTHPYFIGTQSHPEFLSRPGKPHPLFDGLIKYSLEKGS